MGYHKFSEKKNDKIQVYQEHFWEGRYSISFNNYVVEKDFAPAGWSLPDTTAFKEIANKLEANGLTKITKAMFNKKICEATGDKADCGLLGLNLNGVTDREESTIFNLDRYSGNYATNSINATVAVFARNGSTIQIRKIDTDKKYISDVCVRLIQD